MTTPTDDAGAAGQEALDALLLMLRDGDVNDGARVAAAKALLDRFLPKEDAERDRREAEERADAIAAARCLLAEISAELAAAKSSGVLEPVALAQSGAPATDNA